MTAGAANWVWANSRAANGSLIVLLAIADECKNGREVEMSVTELARKTRLSDRGVRNAVKDLESLGELSVTPRRGGISRYAIAVTPADSAGPTPADIAGGAESAGPPTPADSAGPKPDTSQASDGTPADIAGPQVSDVFIGTTGSTSVEVKDVPAKPPRDESRPDADRLCEHLARRIIENGNRPPKITQKWRDAARLLIDKDGMTEKQVHDAIDWSQDSEFWRANILSMPKLREKYDTLRQQARRGGKTPGRQNPDDDYAAALQRISERKEAANGTRGNSHDSAPGQVGLPAAADRPDHLRNLAPRHRRTRFRHRPGGRHRHRPFGKILLSRRHHRRGRPGAAAARPPERTHRRRGHRRVVAARTARRAGRAADGRVPHRQARLRAEDAAAHRAGPRRRPRGRTPRQRLAGVQAQRQASPAAAAVRAAVAALGPAARRPARTARLARPPGRRDRQLAVTPEFTGTCFRCNGLGHWAESTACPWLIKAATYNDHIARIDSLRDRYIDLVITVWQKTDYIKFENKLWHDGKVPSQLAR